MQRVRGIGWDRQLLRAIPIVLIGACCLWPASEAAAQSLTGGPINAATGRSQADAVTQNEKELIDREILGGGAPGRGGGLGAASSGLGTFTTGRLRGSDHDALRSPDITQSFSFDTTETSAFANVVVSVPGTVLGGQMKLSGFVGHNDVSLDLKSNALSVLDPNQSGSAENQSIMVGGTALWSLRNTYALATLVGTWGQTTLHDSVDDCGYTVPPHPTGCNHNRYTFNTAGFIATVAAGQVVDLAGPSGPKLDLRGSVGYTHNSGERFKNVFGNEQEYTFSTWSGTAAATLFSNMPLSDGAVLRPYIQGYVRQEWGYRSGFDALVDGTSQTIRLEQDHLYGGVDVGLTYSQGSTTFGAALYYEASGDDHTLGGRLGLSQKLDGINAPAKGSSWSGFYVGINAGMGWGNAHAGTSAVCNDTHDTTFDPPPAENGVQCPFARDQLAVVGAAGTGSMSDRGFLGGAQAGVNLQKGNAVFGFEVDVQSFKLGASRSGSKTDPNDPTNLITVATSFDTDWLFTARSRLGWLVSPNTLLYVTGGLAATELAVKNSLTSSASLAEGAGSASGRVVGWTLGAGAELALGGNWSLRGEYLYMDFGQVTVNTPVSNPAPFTNNLASTVDLTAHLVRAGLNYKF
jgi:outer membrane immunogenic protein